MEFRGFVARRFFSSSLLWLPLVVVVLFAGSMAAQNSPGTLRGIVTDPSGAAVPQATVTVTGAGGPKAATTNRSGGYEIGGLAAGKYTVGVAAKGFANYAGQDVEILAGQASKLDIALTLEVVQENVEVQDQTSTVQVAPTENASALIIKGQDLEALSDDPDELQQELLALAGPSAGPNGGQIYIDGFTGGQLPPKSSIREIRINQNPFSAEFDKLGYGRIEIFTKPGTDQYHGQSLQRHQLVLECQEPSHPGRAATRLPERDVQWQRKRAAQPECFVLHHGSAPQYQ